MRMCWCIGVHVLMVLAELDSFFVCLLQHIYVCLDTDAWEILQNDICWSDSNKRSGQKDKCIFEGDNYIISLLKVKCFLLSV